VLFYNNIHNRNLLISNKYDIMRKSKGVLPFGQEKERKRRAEQRKHGHSRRHSFSGFFPYAGSYLFI
ncbi:hypothetical protein, partial [Dialister succinatiphilus]|uniref:hypothetical protein n=1 Tax=Dialister succinatiphilus TaxID=487173 RepID=UPI003AB78EDA